MKKHKTAQTIAGLALFVGLVLAAMLPANAALAATHPFGCYENGKSVSCSVSPGSNDLNGNPLDPSSNCYTLASGPVQSGDSNWESVSCSDLTTPQAPAAAGTSCPIDTSSTCIATSTGSTAPRYACGSGADIVKTSIDIGCKGSVCNPSNPKADTSNAFCQSDHNAITDALFAIIRLLSDGVGIVVIGSIVVAGIQYTTSRGDPNASAAAMNRIRASLIALLIFIFSYAILNFLIPGAILQ